MSCGCEAPRGRSKAERRVLIIALVLNATMFGVGLIAGLAARSSGLIADSLDMLADASAYAIALAAMRRSAEFKVGVARLSGGLLVALGVAVLVDVVRRAFGGSEPVSWIMLATAALSLAVNATVLTLLTPFRTGEAHLRATWIFTRVDVIANLAVIAAGLGVLLTPFHWLDLVVGAIIGLYVLKEAVEILRDAREGGEARQQAPP